MIDEMAARLPGFRPDVPIVLDDGQTWHLPRPRVRLRPRVDAGGVRVDQEHVFGRDYLSKVEGYYKALEDETPGSADRFYEALFDLSIALIRQNYRLSDEEACSLISFEMGGEGEPGSDRRDVFTMVACGLQKKTSADTSAPT